MRLKAWNKKASATDLRFPSRHTDSAHAREGVGSRAKINLGQAASSDDKDTKTAAVKIAGASWYSPVYRGTLGHTVSPRTKSLDWRGFGSSGFSISRGGMPRSSGNLPDLQTQGFLVCGFSVCGLAVP